MLGDRVLDILSFARKGGVTRVQFKNRPKYEWFQQLTARNSMPSSLSIACVRRSIRPWELHQYTCSLGINDMYLGPRRLE